MSYSTRKWYPIALVGKLAAVCALLTGCGLLFSAGMVKLQFGCLPEGVEIDTPDGPVAIESLKTGDLVTGFRGQPVSILQIHQYREDPTATRHLTITFANRAEVSLSPRHRINGIPAERLTIGDQFADTEVSAIRPHTNVSRSYDLLTEDEGYQIDGIPVNSMIEEMSGH